MSHDIIVKGVTTSSLHNISDGRLMYKQTNGYREINHYGLGDRWTD